MVMTHLLAGLFASRLHAVPLDVYSSPRQKIHTPATLDTPTTIIATVSNRRLPSKDSKKKNRRVLLISGGYVGYVSLFFSFFFYVSTRLSIYVNERFGSDGVESSGGWGVGWRVGWGVVGSGRGGQ